MKTQLVHKFEDIISIENLLAAWQEFVRGKRKKPDVQLFAHALIDNIIQLHDDLANKTYRHGGYHNFKISDPKPRDISKASVRDRLLHHAIYRTLYPFFDRTFIADSYSCRINKGTHKAIERFHFMFRKVSKNNTRICWVLKLDIRKFFASIDHNVLKDILVRYITDQDILWLLEEIIGSFRAEAISRSRGIAFIRGNPNERDSSTPALTNPLGVGRNDKIGLPLGNLTSQLLVNIYMNEFDQFVKHKLKVKYYIRYADDFVMLNSSQEVLTTILPSIGVFLRDQLKLTLHPNKIILKTYGSGVDFLGWVNFSNHRVLRTATKRRMIKRIRNNPKPGTLQSYLGLLKHGNTFKIQQKVL